MLRRYLEGARLWVGVNGVAWLVGLAVYHELEWREAYGRTVKVATSVAGPRPAVPLHFDGAR